MPSHPTFPSKTLCLYLSIQTLPLPLLSACIIMRAVILPLFIMYSQPNLSGHSAYRCNSFIIMRAVILPLFMNCIKYDNVNSRSMLC